MKLAIDDMKNLPGIDRICRTDEEGIEALKQGGWTHLYMDNDLGCKLEGWQILEWGFKQGLIPNIVTLITMNPVGYYRMKLALENEGYKEARGIDTWTKEELDNQ